MMWDILEDFATFEERERRWWRCFVQKGLISILEMIRD
jgi:hypothetical protein